MCLCVHMQFYFCVLVAAFELLMYMYDKSKKIIK